MGEEEVARSFPVREEGVERRKVVERGSLIGRLPGGGIRREVGVSEQRVPLEESRERRGKKEGERKDA